MALQKQRAGRSKKPSSLSIIKRLRARLKKAKTTAKKSSMAFGRNWKRPRFRSPFRRSSFRSQRSSFRPRGRSNGGFSRRAPILGFRVPSILIWLAIVGGGIFFGRDYIKPLIDRFTKKS